MDWTGEDRNGMESNLPRPETCTVVGGDLGEGEMEISRIRPIQLGVKVRSIAKGISTIGYEALIAILMSILLDHERDMLHFPAKQTTWHAYDGRLRTRVEIRQVLDLIETCYTRLKAAEKDRRLEYYEKELTRIKRLLNAAQKNKSSKAETR